MPYQAFGLDTKKKHLLVQVLFSCEEAHKRCVNGGKNAKKVRDLTLLFVRQIPICLTVF